MKTFKAFILAVSLAASAVSGPASSQEAASVTALIVQGQTAYNGNDFAKAISLWQSALVEVRKSGTKQRLGDLLANIGVSYQDTDNTGKALETYNEALSIYREIGDHIGEARMLQDLAGINRNLGQINDALALDQQALTLFRDAKERRGEADILRNIALVDITRGRNDDALKGLQLALDIFREQKIRLSEGLTLTTIGSVYEVLGRYDDALSSHQASLAIAREIKSTALEADSLLNTGLAQFRLGHWAEALETDQQALTAYRATRSRRGEGWSLTNIGLVYLELGRYADALKVTEQSLAIEQQTGNRDGQATALDTMGGIDLRMGRYDDGMKAHQQALTLFVDLKEPVKQLNTLINIGALESARGHYDNALSYNQRALELAKQVNNPLGEASALGNIGNIDETLGRYDDAISAQQQSLAIDRAIKNQLGVADTLSNLGIIQYKMGHTDDALASAQQALVLHRQLLSPRGEGSDLLLSGVVEATTGRYGDALGMYQQKLAIDRATKDRLGESQTLVDIAYVDDALRRYDAARQAAGDAIALLQQSQEPDVLAHALGFRAFAEAHLNQNAAALADYEAGLGQTEALRAGLNQKERAGFFSTVGGSYDDYIQFLVQLDRQYPGKGYDRKAVDVLERKEARSLLEEIAGSAVQRFQGVPADVAAREQGTDAALDAAHEQLNRAVINGASDRTNLQAALDSALAQRAAFEKELQATYPLYYALLHPKPLTADALQQSVLGPNEAMLIYDVTPFAGVVVAVTRDHVAAALLPNRSLIATSVARVRKHIDSMLKSIDGGVLPDKALAQEAADDLPAFATDSYALYQVVIPPAIAAIIAQKRLTIVPSGPLYDVPWEALVTRAPDATSPHYLIEDQAVSYTPSGSLLALVRSSEHAGSGRAPLLAFANPATAGGAFAELPGTAVEAAGVRDALHASAESIVSGENATKRRLLDYNDSHQLAKFRYVLFATHAVLPRAVNGVNQPALVLAHPEKDGFVTMGDVFGLSLDADFVALSACSTGEGDRDPADGISGMTRAFIFAGTPAISVTLWEVDDSAAPQITPPFFAAMSGGTPPSEALRQAKIAMLHSSNARFRHPYAWAPTVIFGDGGAPGH